MSLKRQMHLQCVSLLAECAARPRRAMHQRLEKQKRRTFRHLGKKDSWCIFSSWVWSALHTSHPSVCLIGEREEMDHCHAGKECGQQVELLIRQGRAMLRHSLCKYPSGLRKAEEGSRGRRGKQMDSSLIWPQHCFSQGLWLRLPASCQMLHERLLSATKRCSKCKAAVFQKHI